MIHAQYILVDHDTCTIYPSEPWYMYDVPWWALMVDVTKLI